MLSAPVAAHLAYTSLRLTLGTAATTRALASARSGLVPGRLRFVVLLPMLREDQVLEAACQHLAAAIRAGVPLDVIVATSPQETEERDAAQAELLRLIGRGDRTGWTVPARLAVAHDGQAALAQAMRAGDFSRARDLVRRHRRQTTAEVAETVLPTLNVAVGRRAYHHAPAGRDAVSKVDKMNAALLAWSAAHPDEADHTYVGVYDADSKTDLAVFGAMQHEVAVRAATARPGPEIFQQVACYCQNLRDLTGMSGAFSIADALAQTRWALGFEYQLYQRSARRVARQRVRPLVYCVGHGCFVSLRFLTRVGGFPTQSPTDDLALGYLASALGVEVAPVPVLDYCDVAPRPLLSAKQSAFWFSGSARFWRDLRHYQHRFGIDIPLLQRGVLHLDGHARNLAWATRGPAWLAATVLALGTGPPWLVGALVLLHAGYVQGGFVQTVRALHRLPGAQQQTGIDQLSSGRLALAGAAASGTFLLRSLGPLTAALRRPRGVRKRSTNRPGRWKLER